MRYRRGIDRNQLTLFPEASLTRPADGSLAARIDAFVEALDDDELGLETFFSRLDGRPGYDPRDLAKLHLFASLRHRRSCRRLAREVREREELAWLLRGLEPSFKTIAQFRKRKGPALERLCRRFLEDASSAGVPAGPPALPAPASPKLRPSPKP